MVPIKMDISMEGSPVSCLMLVTVYFAKIDGKEDCRYMKSEKGANFSSR